ncbi:MAG: DUF1501 domain-containing protein [Lewinellaceae bacterium]|nr:DUF1501 domain-containing protein [Saprospiraceae bacterium]MCB9341378.1 DUF1501 domain-containing protein [Lewinellaceae bacterium]
MRRRKFIQSTGLSLTVLLNGFSVRTLARSSMFSMINGDTDKVLVLLQLVGGNDGLAMITPLDQYDKLANARGNILIPQGSLLDVGFNNAFHPAMTGLKSVFDDGKMSVVQAVGYPNQNRSHFRSTDIWTSGSPADEVWTTGWMGRYFQQDHPGYPDGYPSADFPHPFAITIGSSVSETCQGTAANYSLAITDPFNLNPLLTAGTDTPPNTPYGDELTFLRQTIEQTNAYGEIITDAANSASNMVAYPGDNRLAQQLKNVALMIAGGLQTKVYIVSLGGFDTHSAQVGDTPTVGDHANLLLQLSDAVNLFQQDLTLQGLGERVLTMTFSEFGRRIRSNDSAGTDHGDAAPLMLFGHCVNPGFVGDNPEIPDNPDVLEAVAMQYDFRNIYGSVFMDWFGVEENAIKDLLFPDFAHVPILGGCSANATSEPAANLEVNAFPNPFSSAVNISFACGNEQVRLSVFNGWGQELEVLVNKRLPAGQHRFAFDGSRLPAGHYYFHLRLDGGRQKVKMLVRQ